MDQTGMAAYAAAIASGLAAFLMILVKAYRWLKDAGVRTELENVKSDLKDVKVSVGEVSSKVDHMSGKLEIIASGIGIRIKNGGG